VIDLKKCTVKTWNYSITYLFKSRSLWHDVEKYGRSGQARGDNVIRRMRIACLISKARIQVHRIAIINTYWFSREIIVTPKRLCVTFYVHCPSFFLSNQVSIFLGIVPFSWRWWQQSTPKRWCHSTFLYDVRCRPPWHKPTEGYKECV